MTRLSGFTDLAGAQAHRRVVGTLLAVEQEARQLAEDLRPLDRSNFERAGSESGQDLSPRPDHVVVLGFQESLDAEASWTESGTLRHLRYEDQGRTVEVNGSQLTLEQNGITTSFRVDHQRGLLTVMDPDSEVPRLFGDAEPADLGAFNIGSGGILILPNA